MASDPRKVDGPTLASGREIAAFLADAPVQAIPGIDGNRAALLCHFNITTALAYAQAPFVQIQRLLGKTGTDRWHTLRGISVFPLELAPRLPQTLVRTVSTINHKYGNAAIRILAALPLVRQPRASRFCYLMYETY